MTVQNPAFSNLEYFCVSANIPGVSIAEIVTPYRNQVGYTPGDRINYDMLTLKFMVDENMANYIEVLKWMQANQTQNTMLRSDLILSILTAKNNVSRQFQFSEVFPVSISGLDFDIQAAEVDYISCTASFRFNYFKSLITTA